MDFTPDDIAFWMSDDQSKKIISEDYKGLRVNPGNTPVDRLISIVDTNYLAFDPENVKFKKLAEPEFTRRGMKYPESADEWVKLINVSNQSDQLKNVLIADIRKTGHVQSQSAKFEMKMQRGTVINCTRIEPSPKDPNILYCGIGPEGRFKVQSRGRYGMGISKNRFKAKYPAGWVDLVQPIRTGRIYKKGSGGMYGLFKKVITVHKKNVLSIRPI